jgi:hypothetical protein
MKRLVLVLSASLVLALSLAAQAIPIQTAHGTVSKVEKDSLTVHTRTPDGKFGPALTLKLTGTTVLTEATTRDMGTRQVIVQKTLKPADLRPGDKQVIAVIYANLKDGPVLLSGVVHPEK